MNKIEVLVVDDEWNMRNLLRIYLSKNGFKVTEARNGHEALRLADQQSFDVILLDVMMPDKDGWDVCSKIRETKQTPIIMLTARTETKDKVRGLNMGADDYLVKPFEPEELIARVYAVIRRMNPTYSNDDTGSKKLFFQDVVIDPEGRQIRIHGRTVDFTPKEFDLFYLLASSSQRAFSRELLLEKVWGGDYYGDIRTVDTHVKNIREKVRKARLSYTPIQTVWGVGYKFQAEEEST